MHTAQSSSASGSLQTPASSTDDSGETTATLRLTDAALPRTESERQTSTATQPFETLTTELFTPSDAGFPTGDAEVLVETTPLIETRDASSATSSDPEEPVDAGVADGASTSEQPSWEGPAIEAQSGFVELEATDYLDTGVAKSASPTKLFYSFHPADHRPDLAPTFVFLNGGPGFATSIGLMAYGTGPMTVTLPAEGGELVPNPWSWTQLGNLLYIDTRHAGFSYATLPDPSNASTRAAEAGERNFNEFVDAADVTRALLRLLASVPGIQDNSVVLVGESYGGTRVTFVLEYLLEAARLRTASWYRDVALAEEIEAHFAAVRDAGVNEPKAQFRAQILIQPFIAHTQFDDQAAAACAPGSREAELAAEYGYACQDVRYRRDPYQIDEEPGWADWLDDNAGEHLMTPASLDLLLGVDASSIVGLPASQRGGAFRIGGRGTAVTEAFQTVFGALEAWDGYHIALVDAAWSDRVYTSPYPCVFFSRVVVDVDTFVTNGELDVVVDTPVLPTTLMKCQSMVSTPFVESISVSSEAEDGVARPGKWVVKYTDDSQYGQRVVRFPTYADAGHMVATRQPRELFEDVRAFLLERGVLD